MEKNLRAITQKCCLLAAVLWCTLTVQAQVAPYSFSQSSGTYTPITGGTVLGTATDDDAVYSGLPIGFTFNYNGSPYTSFGMNVNGWLMLGTGTPSSSYYPISGTSNNDVIAGMGTDLIMSFRTSGTRTSGSNQLTNLGATTGITVGCTVTGTGIPTNTTVTAINGNTVTISNNATSSSSSATLTFLTGELRYQTIGTSPNQTLVLQWSNVRKYNINNDNFNFQIRLNENGSIDVVYGPSVNGATSATAEVGLRGASNSDYNNRTSTTDWSATTPGTTNADYINLSSTVVPASGLTFSWAPPVGCNGTPTAGTASSSAPSACSGVNFTLSLTGNTVASGLTYQWISSTDSVNYVNEVAGTTASYTTSVTASTYFRAIVTCTNSSASDTTAPILVSLNAPALCYCTTALGGFCGDADIANLTLVGTTLNSNPSCVTTVDGDAYQQLPATGSTTATLVAGSSYTLNLTMDAAGISSVWFDWNQNGTFEAGEWTQITTSATFGSVTIQVPNNASLGQTGMRIRTRLPGNTNGATSACDNFGSGEAQDYIITVVAAGACTNPPVAGNIMSVAPVCPGNTVTLVDTGYTLGTTLQWQSSADGSTWADVNGANNGSYTSDPITDTTFFRVMVICADTAYTSAVEVDLNPFYNCYCTTGLGGTCGSSEISNVVAAGTTLNNSSTCNTTPSGDAYTAFPPVGSATGTFYLGSSYSFTITLNEYSIVSAWIDYNHNGVFEPSEWTQISTDDITPTATITIPAGALTGLTGLRIRSRNSFNTNDSTSACLSFGSGECEDYIINLQPTPPCVTPTVGGTAAGSDTVYLPANAQYILTGYTGDFVQWQYATSANGPWSNINGATGDTVLITYNATGTYFIRAWVSTPGCDPDSSNVLQTEAILLGDDVCDAQPVTVGVNGPFTTAGATVEAGEPAPGNSSCSGPLSWCNSTLDGTLWFSFVAPASGRVSIQSPDFDTQLALWDAPSCNDILTGGATLLAAVDDDGDYTLHNGVQYSSYIDSVTCLTPGKTYYIQLDAYSGYGTTRIIITDLGAGPDASFANLPDHICADAAPINLNPTTAGGAFYGYGITGSTLDPAQAFQQLQGQGSFVVYYQFWACYQSTDTVEIDSLPVATVAGITNANCFGDANGAIDINVSGNGPFTYSWTGGATTEDLTGVAAGTYSAMVMDAYNCMVSLSNLTVTEPTALNPTPDSLVNVSCNGGSNGGIYISVAGGTPPYTFAWSNGSTNEDATGLTAGIYTGTVTDSHGCTFTSPQVPITEPTAINVTVDSVLNNACNGEQNGRVYITASNGTTPFSYNWSNGSTNEDLSGVVGGTYTVTVTDANGCSASPVSGTLTDPAAIVITADAVTNVSCNGGSNGAITTTTTGGAGSFSYAWNTTATTDDISGLAAGSYTITATDANNCSNLATFTVTEPAAFAVGVDSVHNVKCFSESTGAVFASTNGGTTPYSYVWSSSQTTEDLNGVPGGSYTLTATDANGCSSSASATVTTPASGVSSFAVVTDEIQGASLGAIDLTASGGTPPYTYSWSNGATTQDLTGLSAGVFSCTITDANGCTKIERDTVDLTIGIGEISSSFSVNLYPNPAQDQFFIELNLPAEQDVAIEIYSVSGQLIQTITDKKVVSTKYAMNMSGEAAGIYYAKIKVEGNTAVRRFVISR